MKAPNEAEEIKEDKSGGVAAFFDLDGTLVAWPSLESRFFRMLRYRREIPTRNYFLWLVEALRLMLRGFSAILQTNKMYLCGVQILDAFAEAGRDASPRHQGGHQAEGQASAPPRRNPRLPVPAFFAQAIEKVAWHAMQGHEIVLVSGTLEPLARERARAMEAQLAARGINVNICVLATRLEEMDGKWTGRVLGPAMFGEAKARAARQLAREMQLDMNCCFAYGDSLDDRWLLAAVGWPAAVNPSKELLADARARGWPVLIWEGKEGPTRRRRMPGEQRNCWMEPARLRKLG